MRGTCHLPLPQLKRLLSLCVSRPHGLSTKMRVLAFCPDDQIEAVVGRQGPPAQKMLAAGADVAGISEPLRRIGQGGRQQRYRKDRVLSALPLWTS